MTRVAGADTAGNDVRAVAHQRPDGDVASRARHVLGVVCRGLVASACFQVAVGAAATNRTDDTARITLERIEIFGTIHRLDKARSTLAPETGSSVFSFDLADIRQLPLGDQTPVQRLMLQAPGVVQGDYGELHIRGEMTQPQYRLNGVIIPEGMSGFGNVFDTRIAQSIRLIAGALPAQYGFRTAGVIDITTKQGLADGGSVALLAGSHNTFSPSFDASGIRGPTSYFVSFSWMRNTQGILNPTPEREALHDRTQQGKGFAYVSTVLGPGTRLGLIAGSAVSRFQIPNVPGQTPSFSLAGGQTVASERLQEKQTEANHYAVLALQGTAGTGTSFQLALFTRYSNIRYDPDPIGDLIYRGAASKVTRANRAAGLQADASGQIGPSHTLRAGFTITSERTDGLNHATVFPGDSTGQTSDTPFGRTDASRVIGRLYGAYVQDEWAPTERLTVIYGVRADRVNAAISAGQISPRLAMLYSLSPRTRVRVGYARYFTPPRLDLIAPTTLALFEGTTAQPEVSRSSPVLPTRMHYFDAGVSRQLTDAMTLGVNAYLKRARHLGDFGQFGPSLVFSPYNWDRAIIKGVELSGSYRKDNWSGYLNVAMSEARASGINSGEYNFGQDELDYINGHWVFMDHDQRYALSGGVSYRRGGTTFSLDAIFGSGMRRTPEGDAPNSSHLPGYLQVNAGAARGFDTELFGRVEARLAVLNVLDRIYEIRDGTGVGVGAPQFGPRRAFYVSVRKLF